MRLIPEKLTPRLVLTHFIVGLVSIGLISAFAAFIVNGRGRSQVTNTLKEYAYLISNQLEEPFIVSDGSPEFTTLMNTVITQVFAGLPDIRYTLYTYKGQLITSNEPVLPDEPNSIPIEVKEALTGIDGVIDRFDQQLGESNYVAVPIIRNKEIFGVLRISVLYAGRMGSTYRTLAILSIFSVVLIIVSAIEAFIFARTLSKPIRNLTMTAEDFSNGKLGARAKPEGPDELRRLADSFNQMAVHLQNNIEGLRAFVANASHELRTPLTAVKLHVDALSEGAINDPAVSTRFFSQIQDELNLMSRTVTDLLDLSRIEAGRDRSDFVMINLNELVVDIGEFWQARANHGGLKLGLELADQSATIFANEDMIRRLINNLLDNAMKNTPPGGSVDIRITLQPEVKKVKLEVRDTGIGIKEDHLARIFERFYRVAPTQMRSARTAGSGLGLAIAKSIVDFHGGKIGVESQLGEGSTFWADFPLERPKYEEHKTVPRKNSA